MLHQPVEAFRPSGQIDGDAALLAATEELRLARLGFEASPENSALEARYETAERAAFDLIVTTPASGYAGLAAKAQVLLVEKSAGIEYPDETSIAAEMADGIQYHEDRIAFALALDIMRLARQERELRLPTAEQAA